MNMSGVAVLVSHRRAIWMIDERVRGIVDKLIAPIPPPRPKRKTKTKTKEKPSVKRSTD